MIQRLCALGGRLRYIPRISGAKSLVVRFLSSEPPLRDVHVPQPSTSQSEPKKVSKEHADHVNPGPPVTLDYIPIPFKKYRDEYRRLQKKFNVYLGVGAVLLAFSLYLAIKEDVFVKEALRAPESYRNRKKSTPYADSVPPKEKPEENPAAVKSDASESSSSNPPPKKSEGSSETSAATALPIVVAKEKLKPTEPVAKRVKEEPTSAAEPAKSISYSFLPEEIPYLLIGAGTASYYAALAIRARDADAKVLIVGDEMQLPYNRPPLSKELWWYGDDKMAETLEYKTVNGRKKNVFYEVQGFYVPPDEISDAEHGGVSLVLGHRVVKLDVTSHTAYLDDGRKIKYKKCLVATGGSPRNLPVVQEADEEVKKKVTLFRSIDDLRQLDEIAKKSRSVTIVGGSFLGSELAYSLNRRYGKTGLKVNQIFREKGNVAHVLPEFLSEYTTKELRECGVNVISGQEVKEVAPDDHGCIKLTLSSGEVLHTDHLVVAIGIDANTDLAKSSGLEVDQKHGGFIVDAELRARSDVWVAGDASSFYDVKLGRRRVEHWEHAQVTGRLAGENMTGGGKPYWHQSSFYSLIAPNAHFQAIGKTDSSLPTVSVFAADEGSKTDDLNRGVVFYLDGRTIVGVVLFNVFGSGIDVARKIIADGKEYDDLREVAKLFELHRSEEEKDDKTDKA